MNRGSAHPQREHRSPDGEWGRFVRLFASTALVIGAALYALVLGVDPYDELLFSPRLDRSLLHDNRRFTTASLARRAHFDGAVIGTSSIMLLPPPHLDTRIGGRFVNLAMGAASPYEQLKILQQFRRHHSRIANLVIGMDLVWCHPEGNTRFIGVGALTPFPENLYDDKWWNDFPAFNWRMLGDSWKQLLHLLGLRVDQRGLDGYERFVPPQDEYDVESARRRIYAGAEAAFPADTPHAAVPGEEGASWAYPDLEALAQALGGLPGSTRKILVFVPRHVVALPAPGSRPDIRLQECKRRVLRIADSLSNAHVIDFMIPSVITTRDEHFWDSVHYTTAVADSLVDLIAAALTIRQSVPRLFSFHSGPDLSSSDDDATLPL